MKTEYRYSRQDMDGFRFARFAYGGHGTSGYFLHHKGFRWVLEPIFYSDEQEKQWRPFLKDVTVHHGIVPSSP